VTGYTQALACAPSLWRDVTVGCLRITIVCARPPTTRFSQSPPTPLSWRWRNVSVALLRSAYASARTTRANAHAHPSLRSHPSGHGEFNIIGTSLTSGGVANVCGPGETGSDECTSRRMQLTWHPMCSLVAVTPIKHPGRAVRSTFWFAPPARSPYLLPHSRGTRHTSLMKPEESNSARDTLCRLEEELINPSFLNKHPTIHALSCHGLYP
jgi:hypothetical protein